ncbi:MAG: choice-of-anchor P family protein [Candidatus Acidiferrum sp.]
MSSDQRIPFHFNAKGHAFSARFDRPVDVPIAAQAATSLPTIGGHAHSRVEDFDVPRLVSFKLGETHVSGSWQEDTIVTTSATAVLKGLSLLEFLTVDKIVSRLTAQYTAHTTSQEGHIIALGSHFENLRLGGHEVKVILRHDLLLNSKTFAELKDNLKNDSRPDKRTGIQDGVALCSLVDKIEVDPGLRKLRGFEIDGHILHIPHFGEIALAELFIEPGAMTLTMLRFKLGSPDGGAGTGGETGTNGKPMPPTK